MKEMYIFKLSLQYQDIIQQIGDEKWQMYQLVNVYLFPVLYV